MHSNTSDTEFETSETKRARGGQTTSFNPERRKEIQILAGWGMPQWQIATLFQCDPKTLRKHCRDELKLGAAEANRTVLGSLFDMATSKRHSACTIFWAKTRCRFGQKTLPPGSKKAPPRAPLPLDGLTVHLNDGEPNDNL